MILSLEAIGVYKMTENGHFNMKAFAEGNGVK